MLRRVKELERYTVHATDGDIGRVHDFYFDDRQWRIRYLVVSTGHWLARHSVLLPSVALRTADEAHSALRVSLTRAQVENSPDADTQKPVSRQHEIELHRHYGFPYYWNAPFPLKYPEKWEEGGDPHLRSANEIIGYFIREPHDEVGHVEDLFVDDAEWAIRYLVVATRDWWPGKRVLVGPDWVTAIRWKGAQVQVDLTRDQIRNAPEYEPSRPVDRAYEERLHDHYGRPKYWEHPG